MTDDTAPKTAESSEQPRGRPFKKGFDQRRWLKGRPKVPKDAKRLAEHLLWEIASEEIENPKTGEKVDRLRVLLRSMTTSKNSADRKEFLDRLLGKVTDRVDVTTTGETKVIIEYADTNSKAAETAHGTTEDQERAQEV